MIFQQTRTILDWTISNMFNFFTSKNDGKNRPKLPKFHHHHDAHLGSLVLCQGFYQLEAKGYPHRPNEVECNHKGWQGPDVGFGRPWNRLVATWGHASSADCQCRGFARPCWIQWARYPEQNSLLICYWTYPQKIILFAGSCVVPQRPSADPQIPLLVGFLPCPFIFRIHKKWQFGF